MPTWVVVGALLRLGMRPWICVAYSAPVAAAGAVFWSILSVKVLSLTQCLGISGTFNYMLVFQAGTAS